KKGDQYIKNYLLRHNQWLKSCIYAYLKLGIPVLLAIELTNDMQGNLGKHLVTLNGYQIDDKMSVIGDPDVPAIISNKICSYFVHDDQVGPFASLKFSKYKKNQFETRLKILGNNKIIYDESENTDEKYKVYSNLKSLIIPLPNSIKVSFGDIYNEITLINNTIETILDGEFIWDIYLTTSNLYKIEVLNEISHSDTKEIPLLFYCLPKYIWVAKVYISQCF